MQGKVLVTSPTTAMMSPLPGSMGPRGVVMTDRLRLDGRSLLTVHDLSDEEMVGLIALGGRLKARKAAGVRGSLLSWRRSAEARFWSWDCIP